MRKARGKITPVIPSSMTFNILKICQRTRSLKRLLVMYHTWTKIRTMYDILLPVSKTYTELFERLEEMALADGKQFNSKCIITACEPGLFSFIQQEVSVEMIDEVFYPRDNFCLLVFYCCFLIRQSITKKTDLGLKKDALNDTSIRDSCPQPMALDLF